LSSEDWNVPVVASTCEEGLSTEYWEHRESVLEYDIERDGMTDIMFNDGNNRLGNSKKVIKLWKVNRVKIIW